VAEGHNMSLDRRHKWNEGVRGEDKHYHYECRVCGKKGIRYDLDVVMEAECKKFRQLLIDNIFKPTAFMGTLK
jgi:hypothetical protein